MVWHWPFQPPDDHDPKEPGPSDNGQGPPPATPSPLASVSVSPLASLETPLPVSHQGESHKFSPAAQRRVCELLGQFRSVEEVREAMVAEYGVAVSPQAIHKYLKVPKWQAFIQGARASFISGLNDIPIAQKVVRLDRYETLYQKARLKGKDNDARLALLGAQKEMEGLVGETNIYVHQNILHMETAELEARRKAIAERLQQLEVSHALSEAGTALRESGAESPA